MGVGGQAGVTAGGGWVRANRVTVSLGAAGGEIPIAGDEPWYHPGGEGRGQEKEGKGRREEKKEGEEERMKRKAEKKERKEKREKGGEEKGEDPLSPGGESRGWAHPRPASRRPRSLT